jgi:hypothetical protein
MRYAQIKSGQKLHLVCEPGEVDPHGRVVRAGYLSHPLCGRPVRGEYRMTINVPLAHACKNCLRVRNALQPQDAMTDRRR